jgi:hypothetical protein
MSRPVSTMPLARRLEELAAAGVAVSICCMPTTAGIITWSVVLCRGQSRQMTVAMQVADFGQAVTFAETEARARGWLERAHRYAVPGAHLAIRRSEAD